MRKCFWPILVIALALLVAGTWVAFPEECRAIGPAISTFCSSFAAEAKNAWTRLFPVKEAPDVPDFDLFDDSNVAATRGDAPINSTSSVPTALGAITDPASDPEPSTLTREQRKQRYKELVAAAEQRKREVMLANLMKSEEGRDALRATRAFQAKADEIKRLDKKHGWTDNRLWALRLELAPLKDDAIIANARYKAWKDAHPGETVDPMSDKLYCDLVARSRFFSD